MKEQPVFVTGATGLVGSHLLYFLLRSGHPVLALRREASRIEDVKAVFLRYPEGERLWEGIQWVTGDVLVKETLEEAVKGSVCVFHCAAVVSFAGEDSGRLQATNLQGTENVASLCLEHHIRLCYVSSIAALGDAEKEGELIDEETPEIPGRAHSVYSRSKGDSEKKIWQYVSRGLDAVIVCPSIILGAGASGKSSVCLYATAAKGVPFFTKGVVGYVDVRDVCRLTIRLAADPEVRGERFVLNGGNYSYRELFAIIARANNRRSPCFYMRPWITEIAWRFLALAGKLSGHKPAFTRETARTAHRKSYYSNQKILSLYPDYRFYSLRETVEEIAGKETTKGG